MICINCGNEVGENDSFCKVCGANLSEAKRIKKEEVNDEEGFTEIKEDTNEAGPKYYRVFSYVGLGLGIASIAFCWCFFIGLFFGIPGIVFSSISKKSKNATNVPTIGQALSIVGIIFSIIVSIIFIAVVIGVSAFVVKNN